MVQLPSNFFSFPFENAWCWTLLMTMRSCLSLRLSSETVVSLQRLEFGNMFFHWFKLVLEISPWNGLCKFSHMHDGGRGFHEEGHYMSRFYKESSSITWVAAVQLKIQFYVLLNAALRFSKITFFILISSAWVVVFDYNFSLCVVDWHSRSTFTFNLSI